ncbi:DUF6241 domain-containing protein [Lysinibacillus sp. 3P01SB]|uniref:DUF6241 domain-containing protein n=1 Tax=Lysinibacillus sp. 3P01SB TaxID=3132284 RepID=UPI0039A5A9BA
MKKVIIGILSVGIIAAGIFVGLEYYKKDQMKSSLQTVEENTPEWVFKQEIHAMTHQKVYASDKWDEVVVTEELIDAMLQKLDEQKEDFKNASFYDETLTAWKRGDFSNAVEVHNEIWASQNGTIGKATRLLTAEEEKQYVDRLLDQQRKREERQRNLHNMLNETNNE